MSLGLWRQVSILLFVIPSHCAGPTAVTVKIAILLTVTTELFDQCVF